MAGRKIATPSTIPAQPKATGSSSAHKHKLPKGDVPPGKSGMGILGGQSASTAEKGWRKDTTG